MTENNRDEKVCRRWDVLADEDHTYHLSEEEYFCYRNNWWLHLNKSGSDTLPLRKRSDFKQALSTLERLHLEDGGEQFAPTPYWREQTMEVGIESALYMVGMARLLVVFLRIQRKSRKRQAKSWESDPLFTELRRKPQTMAFKSSINFVTDRSFTADSGPL